MYFRLFTVFVVSVMLWLGVVGTPAQQNGSSPAALVRCALREVDSPLRGLLAADADNIYLGTVNGTLSSYETKTLGIIWRLELGGEFASEILLIGNGIVVVTNSAAGANGPQESSTLRLIGKDSGVTAWSSKLPYSEKYYIGRLNGGLAAVNREGAVVHLDAASGEVKWKTGSLGTVSAKPAFSVGRVVLGTAEKQVVSISARDGELLNKLPLDFAPTSISFSSKGGTLVGDERGHVMLLGDHDNKTVWKFKSGAGVSSVFNAEEGVLLTSLDNFVYFISDYNGDVIWKRRLPGRLVDGGLAFDGYFVVLMYGENSAYVLDMKNGKVTDVLPPTDKDLINRVPVLVRDKTFVLTTTGSVATYAVGGCGSK
jgi:outer membrane protein assembly factor BamB